MRFFPWQELPLQWIGMYASKSAAFAASPRRGKRPRENVSTSESCSNDGGGARVRKRDSESERASKGAARFSHAFYVASWAH